LSEDEINRMKAEAEQNAAADKAEREKIDKMNQADSMIFTTENFLKDNGDKIPADKKPCSFTIFMQGTSVSPSPKYIIRGKGIGRFSSGIYWFTLLLSLTCLIPLLILKRNCVLVV
jgi:hypothetical protein